MSDLLRLAGVGLLAACPLHGQSAGSESHATIAQGLAGSGGSSTNAAGDKAATTVGQNLTGEEATSTNYRVRAGVSWVTPTITHDDPIVFGVSDGAGRSTGSKNSDVFGFNFTQPGAGALDISFDGGPPVATAVVSNLQANLTTPPGVDGFNNPLAEVPVAATNLLGSHTAQDAYIYTPAMLLESPASVGGRMEMRLQLDPGDVYFLAMGKNVDGFALPVGPWDGALELILNVEVLQSGIPAPHGTSIFQLDVPNDPNLAGGTLKFQGFSVSDFVTPIGGFSNRLDVTFQP